MLWFKLIAALLGVLLCTGAASSAEWFVSPEGDPDGRGTIDSPWDLPKALQHPEQVQPGDTIWLRGGTYLGTERHTFTATLKGDMDRPITVRQFPGERAVISPTLTIGGEYTWYMGFEVHNPDDKEYEPYDHGRWPCIDARLDSRGIKLINLTVHGGGQGIGGWTPAQDLEVYGCVVFHNGWAGSNQGHGIYTQNREGTKRLIDNIFFNQLGRGYGVHAYGSANAFINNFHLEGNVSFNNQGNNILVGGGSPSENINMISNYSWAGGGVRIGYTALNKNAVVRNNFFFTHCTVNNWEEIAFAENKIISDRYVMILDISKLERMPQYRWDMNAYAFPREEGNPFQIIGADDNRFRGDFEQWQRNTSFDRRSRFTREQPAGVDTFVRPNKYAKGRANIIVFNWEERESVEVDMQNVLERGDRFEVRDVENWFGEPVIRGTYRGGTIRLPMNLKEVSQPVTEQKFEHTPPEFNVFVVLPIREGGLR